ncbi:hypothetical protein [Burkholderia ubonensis]|uniref:hypothetical protein n=1 Tax=Burkholderia ubonensis TaxID=101571 RepID=UPI000B1800C4|nr:hypothetical protein [Burkholderia ubonensis]
MDHALQFQSDSRRLFWKLITLEFDGARWRGARFIVHGTRTPRREANGASIATDRSTAVTMRKSAHPISPSRQLNSKTYQHE